MSKNNAVPPPFNPPKSKLALLREMLSCSGLKQRVTSFLSLFLLLGTVGYLTVKTPELHRLFLRLKVGSKVYMIKASARSGGGTGFALKAPSGQSYIVTNSHVCDYIQEMNSDGMAYVQGQDETMRRHIIENSDFTDLCIIEGMPGVEGLSVGGEPGLGSQLSVVGHPRLRPLTITQGDIVGSTDVPIFYGLMQIDGQPGDYKSACDLPKNQILEVDVQDFFGLFHHVKACLTVTQGAYMSNITIFPGNSGSPVVDNFGRVVGVAFAADETNWAMIVSNKDLVKFIKNY